jgi:hypothetical protein
MPATYSSSRLPLGTAGPPRCAKCDASMTEVHTAPGPRGFDIRTFDCADCDHVHIVTVATGI